MYFPACTLYYFSVINFHQLQKTITTDQDGNKSLVVGGGGKGESGCHLLHTDYNNIDSHTACMRMSQTHEVLRDCG